MRQPQVVEGYQCEALTQVGWLRGAVDFKCEVALRRFLSKTFLGLVDSLQQSASFIIPNTTIPTRSQMLLPHPPAVLPGAACCRAGRPAVAAVAPRPPRARRAAVVQAAVQTQHSNATPQSPPDSSPVTAAVRRAAAATLSGLAAAALLLVSAAMMVRGRARSCVCARGAIPALACPAKLPSPAAAEPIHPALCTCCCSVWARTQQRRSRQPPIRQRQKQPPPLLPRPPSPTPPTWAAPRAALPLSWRQSSPPATEAAARCHA